MSHNEQPLPGSADDRIRQQAREWFVMLLDAPTPARQTRFEQWLREDPAHFDAYRAIEASWHASEMAGQRLARQEADELSVYLKAMDKAKNEKKTFRRLSALSILLAGLLGGAIWLERPGLLQELAADYTTGRGERRTVVLADGSSVLLDADSAIAEMQTTAERRIRLLRGGGFFDVRPSQVPFIVEASNGEVRVLGTGFDIRLTDSGGMVTLEHGSVAVSTGNNPDKKVLKPGQQVRFGQDGIGPVEAVELDDALAWRGGRFVFYRTPLADVVQEIRRYRKGRIVIASSTLANELVTGSFPLSDTDAALASLQSGIGFRISRLGSLTILGP